MDKDALIDSLQEELTLLGRQVGEFNDLRLSIVKVAGKNAVRKLKSKVMTTSDRVNGHCIGAYLRKVLWPDIKMMPSKWFKWSENPRSICQRILSLVGVPRGVTKEDYWVSMAVSMANNKLCAMRSNMKQAMFNQFQGKVYCKLNIVIYMMAIVLTNDYVICCNISRQEQDRWFDCRVC